MIAATHWQLHRATGLPIYAIEEERLEQRYDKRMREIIHRLDPDRSARLALVGAAEAVDRAGWREKSFPILVGSSRGPTESWERAFTTFATGSPLPPSTSPRTTLGSPAFLLAHYFGSHALTDGLSVTCSSGFHALLHGVALLRAGMAERVLVGGAEAPLTDFTLQQMAALGVYAKPPARPDQPACLPFVRPATGMALGEGAGFLALERTKLTDNRLHLLGLGFARETGRGRTGITPEGDALTAAMTTAIAEAKSRPALVVPHAPGTSRGDAAELAALTRVFGAELPELQSYKSTTGHTFGASGPIALVQASRHTETESVLVNATGFGGNAISVIAG